MRRHIGTIILLLIFFTGLSMMLYPTVSDYINKKHQSSVIATYDEDVARMNQKKHDEYFAAAEEYNKQLAENPDALYDPSILDGYEDILNISGIGIMGYIEIDKIDVKLPIYHGVSTDVLALGAGHIEGSSLPVGGESTHCIITAHRGLPSAKLFTDLDKMEIGDTFNIQVLDEVFTYEVDKISVVFPDESELLQIEEGKDYCTLATCTPYGINTHRLLVRGHRVENEADKAASTKLTLSPEIIALIIAAVLLLIWLIIYKRKRRAQKN